MWMNSSTKSSRFQSTRRRWKSRVMCFRRSNSHGVFSTRAGAGCAGRHVDHCLTPLMGQSRYCGLATGLQMSGRSSCTITPAFGDNIVPIQLSENQFADIPKNRNGPTARFRGHPFDRACWRHGIEHRLTKPKHPWTNGQVERMNRTIKEATVKRYHYDSHDQLRRHIGDFVSAYNFARRLKTLRGLTPYEYICSIWTKEPKKFRIDPIHQMPGLNT